MRRAWLAPLVLAACGTPIDPATLPPAVSIAGYHDWGVPLTLSTRVPGHGDSVRDIYYNAVARSYPHGGRYPLGAVFVKETFANEDGVKGGLVEISIMRKVGDDAGVPTQDGWLYTDLDGGEETQKDSCFSTCHRSAPFDGAWFDHGM